MSGEVVFDPKTLSDDDLLKKSSDLQRKMGWAQRFASAGQGMQQMAMMLAQIEDERRERMFMERWQLAGGAIADPIETDPDLRDRERAARERARAPEPVVVRPRIAPRRALPTPTAHGFGAPLRATAAPVIPATESPTARDADKKNTV